MVKRKMVAFLMLIILSISPIAEATTGYAEYPVYAFLNVANYNQMLFNHTYPSLEYVVADTSKGNPPTNIDPGVTLTQVSFKFSAKWADRVEVYWYDWQDNQIGTNNIELTGSQPLVVTAPSGAYAVKARLFSSNVDGWRHLWFNSATNSVGNTVLFPEPDGVGGEDPGGGDPGGGDPVSSSDIIERLDDIISNQEDLLTKTEAVKNRLGDVVSRLDTANNHLNAIRSDVNDLRGYIMTPRQSVPLSIGNLLPTPVIDPTTPSIEEPYQQPYKYNRTQPSMQPFEDSPGPLPINPEPDHYIMPHDPVTEREQPLSLDTPRQRDPVIKDQPLTLDPVILDDPRQRDPVILDEPIQRDPVLRDEPIIRENPLSPDAPLQRETPLTRDEPITLDPPMN